MSHNFKVGQRVYRLTYNNLSGNLHPDIVTKVGRKWISLQNDRRFDAETLKMDGSNTGYGPGRVYLSAETYRDECALSQAWNEVRSLVAGSYSTPDGVTPEAINQALTLLGLKL